MNFSCSLILFPSLNVLFKNANCSKYNVNKCLSCPLLRGSKLHPAGAHHLILKLVVLVLQELEANPAPTASAEALIDFARIFYAKRGWNMDKQLESARDGLMAKIQTLFSDSFFAPTKTWFQSIVYRGADLVILGIFN